jgi:hypothetical protein
MLFHRISAKRGTPVDGKVTLTLGGAEVTIEYRRDLKRGDVMIGIDAPEEVEIRVDKGLGGPDGPLMLDRTQGNVIKPR